jgi:plastocyanin
MPISASIFKCAAIAVAVSAVSSLEATAQVQKPGEIQISYKDKAFTPAEVSIPANTAVTFKVKNLSDKAMEFESKPLKIEKVIAAKSEAIINVRPQKAGQYKFVDEFNEDVAIGKVIVK